MKVPRKTKEMANLQEIPEMENLDIEGSVDDISSEIGRLDVVSPGLDSPTERGLAKTRKNETQILKLISQTKALGSNTLDLCNKGLLQIPRELLELNNLEYLYLEKNELTSLPDDFFDCLPKLAWLDLRQNKLLRLPSVYTGRHQNLRTLLLEGNNLRSLPLELGLIKSLHGLNISNNPMEFPPKDIIEKGTSEILRFLRDMLQAKSSGKLLNGGYGDGSSSSSSDDWDDGDDLQDYAKRRQRTLALDDAKSTTTKSSDPFGPVPQSLALHRPVSYTERKQEKAEKVKRAGASGTVESRKRSASSVMSWKVNPYPEPPSNDYIEFKMNEERKIAKVKELKEKTDAILQRHKDEEVLKDWRTETKKIQQKKNYESLVLGKKTDYVNAVEKAPFDIDKNHVKLPTNEERIKQDVKSAHEKARRALSPGSKQRIEQEKNARIRELERRIKDHTSKMHERRKMPKGSPQEEMEAARRELEIAEDLHRELMSTRKNLEYRFRAFTADIASGYTTREKKAPRN